MTNGYAVLLLSFRLPFGRVICVETPMTYYGECDGIFGRFMSSVLAGQEIKQFPTSSKQLEYTIFDIGNGSNSGETSTPEHEGEKATTETTTTTTTTTEEIKTIREALHQRLHQHLRLRQIQHQRLRLILGAEIARADI